LVSKPREDEKLLTLDAQRKTKGPSLGEILPHLGYETAVPAHGRSPGQGNATFRSRGRSTLV
jgi:hypothetical protein